MSSGRFGDFLRFTMQAKNTPSHAHDYSIFCSNDSLKCDPVPSGGGFSGRRVRAIGLSRCDTLCILATLLMRSVESRKFAISMLVVCTCVRTVLEVNEVPAPKVESASSTAKSGPVTNYIYTVLHHIMHCLCIL